MNLARTLSLPKETIFTFLKFHEVLLPVVHMKPFSPFILSSVKLLTMETMDLKGLVLSSWLWFGAESVCMLHVWAHMPVWKDARCQPLEFMRNIHLIFFSLKNQFLLVHYVEVGNMCDSVLGGFRGQLHRVCSLFTFKWLLEVEFRSAGLSAPQELLPVEPPLFFPAEPSCLACLHFSGQGLLQDPGALSATARQVGQC